LESSGRSRSTSDRRGRPLIVACCVFVLTALVAACLVARFERDRLQHKRILSSGYAKDHARLLEVHVDRALSATYALAALVRVGNGNIPNFDEVAAQMLPLYPGASELVLSVGGRIQNVAPLHGNEKAIGLDLLNYPGQKAEASISRDTGKLTLAGPFELVQGGLALAGRLPVFLSTAQGTSFWGFTEVVMRLPEALTPAQLSQLVARGYNYELWRIHPETGRKQVIDASSRLALIAPVEQTLQVPNGTWTLSVAPVEGWRDPLGIGIGIGLGLSFSLLLAYLAKVLLELEARREELEMLVARRTASIVAGKNHRKRAERAARMSKTRLSVTLEATQVSIWDWNITRDRWYVSRSYFTSLGYKYEAGQPDREIWLSRIHPEDRPNVRRMIDQALTGNSSGYEYEARILHADGPYRWISVRGRVVQRDSRGLATRMLGVRIDITEHKEAEERIQRLAHFDALTGLPNRTLLDDRITYAIGMAQRQHESMAVLILDIDKFKNINDTFGHSIGDELLMEVARRMKSSAREDETVARIAADEFILVLPGTDANRAAHVAQQLLESLSSRYRIEQLELVVTLSIGIAMYPSDGRDFDGLLKCADTAMHRAKDDGRNRYVFFTAEMQAISARKLLVENALRNALERSELQVYYQPQVSLTDGRISGAEALLRWTHPDLGSVPPSEFIAVAEDSGQILQIGTWVLRGAVTQLKAWLDSGLPPMTMAVNLSSVQFRHPNLPELVRQILAEANMPPHCLELELTERVAMGDPLGIIAVMNNLHQLGVRISIDDFGTGYSSLNYLKRFHAYKLKIDQSFVSGVTEDPEDQGIVCAIINLANSLGLHTTAEGVETAGQLAFLRAQGCNEAQGYYFSKPLPADSFADFVRDKATRGSWWE
jgi:diguanylate cyclase (GGDEF)-like protein/PAS domain S-box-containing protein